MTSFSFSQTVQADSTIVFTPQEFDKLLIKMNSCVLEKDRLYLITVEQDSLLGIQDSLIATYEYKDGLVKPFYQQEWFKAMMYSIIGAFVQDKLKSELTN